MIAGRVTMPARELLAACEDRSVGLVVTDPPWKLSGGGKFGEAASYDLLPVPECAAILADARRALVEGGHLYCFAPASDALPVVLDELRGHGWRFVRSLAWDKGAKHALGAYRNAWEPILIFSNGKSRGFEQRCVFPSLLKARGLGVRTAKPWPLYKVAIEMSSRPGELVVDPFCGTNPLAEAARHVSPPRRWLAGDVLSEAAVRADVQRRNLAYG